MSLCPSERLPQSYRVAPRTVSFESVPKPPRAQARILPRDAREILLAASQHRPRSSRVTAINVAINKVRTMYPAFFKEEI